MHSHHQSADRHPCSSLIPSPTSSPPPPPRTLQFYIAFKCPSRPALPLPCSLVPLFRPPSAGKVVFMAPTRPLVLQQIRACREIVGLPRVRPALRCV